MRTLHLAAMPFPSQQGTQALVHAILTALSAAGHDTHLLCYPHAGFDRRHDYTVHRSFDVSRERSLRSGPSLRKLAQDAQLVRDTRRLYTKLRPARVIAHHVEAAFAAHLACLPKVSFVAHTSLAAELPSYFAPRWRRPLTATGLALDRFAAWPAARCLATSPLLQRRLTADTGRAFELLVPPWPVHAPIAAQERSAARTELQVSETDEVVLYAGNLDAYQGLNVLCAGLALAVAERPRLRWLLATASDASRFMRELDGALAARTRVIRLCSDGARRRVHAAADLSLVPRAVPGGLPIKLLDALAHGLAVLTNERGTAGFDFGRACHGLDDGQPACWALHLGRYFELPISERRLLSSHAGDALRGRHSAAACVQALLDEPCG